MSIASLTPTAHYGRWAQLKALSQDRYVGSYWWRALLYLSLGNRDEAIRQLEQAVDHHDDLIMLIKVDPLLDRLRGDPRFEVLV